MSTLTRPDYDPDEPIRYAPKWMREAHVHPAEPVPRLSRAAQFGAEDDPAHESAYQPAPPRDLDEDPGPVRAVPRRMPEFEGDVAIKRMREARAFRAEEIPEPRWREPTGFPLAMLLRFGAAIVVATFAALLYVGAVPVPAAVWGMIASLGQSAETDAPRMPMSDGSVATTAHGGDVALAGPAAEAAAMNASMKTDAGGSTMGVANTVATVPWPQDAASAPAATSSAEPPPAALAMRRLDQEEIDTLIRRGEAFILQGDFAAARLMLQRAAEAGNGRAAVMLGATYDPVMLRRVGVVGLKAEPERAREWYERAVALGSSEASARMAELGRD
ncbi:hypothetical protein RA307_21845 [Xanthobacteraceae bacterium Astr-EGSB]|uniref:hypothetical protein n=1 Tax=Astrobacterium formosum TaxID=3069710 RepID=UPI0027B3175A|nr:hypothetical protein [Xanthobacteraceae bacterium Astr-EGSB]